MNNLPIRKPNRLQNYNYSQTGSYFVTVCIQDMRCILSNILPGETEWDASVELTKTGQCVHSVISEMAQRNSNIRIDRFVIMPNHIHLLISIGFDADCGVSRTTPPTNTLSRFIGTFKRFSQKSCGERIWQRGFYDHIIRDEDDYLLRWRYIDENPKKWLMGKDAYYTV